MIFHVFGAWLGTIGRTRTVVLFLHHSDGDFGSTSTASRTLPSRYAALL